MSRHLTSAARTCRLRAAGLALLAWVAAANTARADNHSNGPLADSYVVLQTRQFNNFEAGAGATYSVSTTGKLPMQDYRTDLGATGASVGYGWGGAYGLPGGSGVALATAWASAGQLHAGAAAVAAGLDSTSGASDSAHALASTFLADRLSLTDAGTVTVHGRLDGVISRSNSPVSISTASLSMSLWFIDPTPTLGLPGTDGQAAYHVLGGYSIVAGDGNSTGFVDVPFSVPLNLPATDPNSTGGGLDPAAPPPFVFVFAQLQAQCQTFTAASQGADCNADFTHTLKLDLTVPDGLGISTAQGLMPLTTAVPEPASLALWLAGLGMLAYRQGRRRGA